MPHAIGVANPRQHVGDWIGHRHFRLLLALYQRLNLGISTGALFLLVGVIYERRHTRMIAEYGGISAEMPVFATIFLIITMSSIGLPALNGFVGEFTILVGAFHRAWWWALMGALGIVLGAAYMLWMYQRVFFGELRNEKNKDLADLNLREQWTLIPLIVIAFWIGLYPKPFFDRMQPTVDRVLERVSVALPALICSPSVVSCIMTGSRCCLSIVSVASASVAV